MNVTFAKYNNLRPSYSSISNNNNKINSLALISSKNPSSVAQQNQRILGILMIIYNAKIRQQMDGFPRS